MGFPRSGATATEGDSGTTINPVVVELSGPSSDSVTVYYTVGQPSYGTATAGEDYLVESGSVVFAPGQTSATIPVTVYGDTDYEAQERLYITLTSAIGAQIVAEDTEGYRTDQLLLRIDNDDPAVSL